MLVFMDVSGDLSLGTLLQDIVSRGASDLHLISGIPPVARISGEIGALPYPPMNSELIMKLLNPYLSEFHRDIFRKEMRLSISHTIKDVGRFRFSLYQSLGTPGVSIRVIPTKTYPLAALGLPAIVG